MSAEFLDQAKFNLEILKLFGAGAAFLLALFQYTKAQKWKRKEYVSNQMEKFFQNPDVILSMQMLDWLERPLTLKSGRTFDFNNKCLKKILAGEGKSNVIRFSAEEAELRDSFSTFLDYLQQFNSDIASGLIKKEDLEIYLSYWLQKISSVRTASERETVEIVNRFINDYGYSGVTDLVGRYLDTEENSLLLKSN